MYDQWVAIVAGMWVVVADLLSEFRPVLFVVFALAVLPFVVDLIRRAVGMRGQ